MTAPTAGSARPGVCTQRGSPEQDGGRGFSPSQQRAETHIMTFPPALKTEAETLTRTEGTQDGTTRTVRTNGCGRRPQPQTPSHHFAEPSAARPRPPLRDARVATPPPGPIPRETRPLSSGRRSPEGSQTQAQSSTEVDTGKGGVAGPPRGGRAQARLLREPAGGCARSPA